MGSSEGETGDAMEVAEVGVVMLFDAREGGGAPMSLMKRVNVGKVGEVGDFLVGLSLGLSLAVDSSLEELSESMAEGGIWGFDW